MTKMILQASEVLMFFAIWIGVPSLLIAVLLVLGCRMKNRVAIIISAFGFAGLACWSLSLTLQGLVSGEAISISRHWGTVSKAADVQGYWLATIFWTILSFCIFGFSCWLILNAFKRRNISVKMDDSRPLP